MYISRRIGGVRDACAYRAVILLTSQRHGGMASMSGQYRIKSGQGCQKQNKNFYRYIGDKIKGKENVGPLQRETGRPVIHGKGFHRITELVRIRIRLEKTSEIFKFNL